MVGGRVPSFLRKRGLLIVRTSFEPKTSEFGLSKLGSPCAQPSGM